MVLTITFYIITIDLDTDEQLITEAELASEEYKNVFDIILWEAKVRVLGESGYRIS